jgi:hypothetical protein
MPIIRIYTNDFHGARDDAHVSLSFLVRSTTNASTSVKPNFHLKKLQILNEDIFIFMKYNVTAVNIMLVYQSITDNTYQQCSYVSTDIFNKMWLIDWLTDRLFVNLNIHLLSHIEYFVLVLSYHVTFATGRWINDQSITFVRSALLNIMVDT